ncbi:hypothetical protein DC007_14700, partial [Enterococcus faecalis]
QGKLEFTKKDGFLEIGGHKTKLITKRAALAGKQVTDGRFHRIFQMPRGNPYASPDMWLEGVMTLADRAPGGSVPIFTREDTVVPAMSGKFVPLSTGGAVRVRDVLEKSLV